jgi:DNA-binding IclR family transcriptional regulator
MAKESQKSPVKSAERTLAVLEYFREKKRAGTVGEIAEALSWPQSSTTMLLKSLLALGYLDYTAQTRKYRPTYRVALLGNWIQKSLFKNSPLTDIMETIGEETGETVLLGLQNGPHLQYVHVVPARYSIQLAAQVGILRPMTRAALGRVLLAPKADNEIKAIVRRNNADATRTVHRVNERQFLSQIADIRKLGFAESAGSMVPGGNTIAMLVPGKPDETPLAIGVGGPIARIAERRVEILRVMRRYMRQA